MLPVVAVTEPAIDKFVPSNSNLGESFPPILNVPSSKSNIDPARAPKLLDFILPVVIWSPSILVVPTEAFGDKYKASTCLLVNDPV